jgi:hypothetical protein
MDFPEEDFVKILEISSQKHVLFELRGKPLKFQNQIATKVYEIFKFFRHLLKISTNLSKFHWKNQIFNQYLRVLKKLPVHPHHFSWKWITINGKINISNVPSACAHAVLYNCWNSCKLYVHSYTNKNMYQHLVVGKCGKCHEVFIVLSFILLTSHGEHTSTVMSFSRVIYVM